MRCPRTGIPLAFLGSPVAQQKKQLPPGKCPQPYDQPSDAGQHSPLYHISRHQRQERLCNCAAAPHLCRPSHPAAPALAGKAELSACSPLPCLLFTAAASLAEYGPSVPSPVPWRQTCRLCPSKPASAAQRSPHGEVALRLEEIVQST
jgi:hypothetical protein